MTKHRAPAVGFIVVVLLIDMIGFGIIIPVMPGLIQELTGGSVSLAAQYGGWMLAAYAITQFFCAPIIGGLSDRFGRRPVLLASLFGFGLDYLFLAFAPSIGWLFVGRVIAGMMGASFVAASAYMADISTPENRAKNFGLIGAMFGLGFIIGPVIGGFLGEFGSRTPFFVTAGLTAVNWLYGYFVLPESLPKENRRQFDWKRANPVGTVLSVWQYKVVSGLFFVLALLYVSAHAVQSNWAYYTIEKFSWTTGMIGLSLGVVGLVFVVVQGGLIRVILPKLGQQRTVYAGLMLYAIGFLLYAVASQSWMMYAVTVVYCMGGIAGPALQGIMSSAVPPNAQGELQGAFASLMSMTAVVGPPLMNGIFAWFSSSAAPFYFPGAAMVLGAVLTSISCLLARATLKGVERSPA
ncbi:MAG TPA: TCR/Tet family MFS transporter [Gammaproteobacteria bacterium]|nr:TCR/Tet family MFS transporter [Gammaproteobacteria bacterium]